MNALQTLRDQRNTVAKETRNLLDTKPGRLWNAAAQKDYDLRLLAIERLDDQIGDAERARDADTATRLGISEVAARDLRPSAMFNTWIRADFDGFTSAQMLEYRNTLSTTTGAQGGFSVASDVSQRFVDTLKDFSGVRRVAEVIVTDQGGVLPWPVSDGTAETGEQVVENATATSLDPVFGTAPLSTFRYSSKIFTAPIELLSDSNLDIEQFILDRAAQRIGRITNTKFTIGTGSGEPQGFTGAAGVGKVGTTGQTTTVIHDDLIDLIHSVNTSYRQDPTASAIFMMSDAAFKMCRKLKDSNGRPIYLPDQTAPESILNYEVIVNDDVAVPAANARSVFFGNFKQSYKIRDCLEVSLFRFADSAFTKFGQVGFLAFARSGGNLVDVTGVKAYVHSAT